MKSFARGFSVLMICFLAGTLLFDSKSLAQQVKAAASVDSSTILIGDQVRLTLTVDLPAAYLLDWPVLNDTLTNNIEVVARSAFDTLVSADKQRYTLKQVVTLTCFDSGYYAIPPFNFVFRKPGDTTRNSVSTSPVMLMVRTVAVDTASDFKDIKPPLKAPLSFREILPWLLLVLGVLLLLGAAIYVYLRLKNNKAIIEFPSKPKVPAHVTALAELEKLRVAHLWQYGKTKEYHSLLSDILRVYVQNRWDIIAMEMITDDIIQSLGKTNVTGTDRQLLLKVLQITDMVKFAKYEPLPDENDLAMKNAVAFVMSTRESDDELNRTTGEGIKKTDKS